MKIPEKMQPYQNQPQTEEQKEAFRNMLRKDYGLAEHEKKGGK